MVREQPKEPLIFLSYAREDQEEVSYFYERLRSAGLNAWMDKYSLKGGQNWDIETKKALKEADVILCFLSESSVRKRGYVQREFKIALDHAFNKLDGDIYIIPVLLDLRAEIPEQLAHLHAISGSREELANSIIDSIFTQLQKTGGSLSISRDPESVSWSVKRHIEGWEGLPGYEVQCDLINITSDKFRSTDEISEIINGALFKSIHESRRVKFRQDPLFHSFGQEKFFRTDTWEANCDDVVVTGSTLSIQYSVYWYGAGAAHPNSQFLTFCFSLDPLIYIENISEIFQDENVALGLLKAIVRNEIISSDNGEDFEKDWVESGTENWDDFRSFVFTKDGIKFLFSPYQIAAYALGSHAVLVPYASIADKLDRNFVHLLGISYLERGWVADEGSGK